MTDPIAAPLRSALAGRYRLEGPLGSGGMSVVFRAIDLKHDRAVAIKVLRPELAQAVGAERFLREIRIAAHLQHPHILGLIDSGRASDGAGGELLFYVMPYVEGESLRRRLDRDGRLPIPETVRILREVADALAKAHRAGVVHRDIKPDNIMLSDGHALVMDFGVARAVAAGQGDLAPSTTATAVGVTVGTPAYMAPEQIAADPQTDQRADLYALGIVGYELLAGAPPFRGDSLQQVLASHLAATPEPITARRPDTPAVLADAVMCCLEKDPAKRFASAEDLRARLDLISTGTGEGAATGRRPSRRRQWVTALLVGLAGVAVATFLLRREGAEPSSLAADDRSLAVLPLDNLGGDSTTRFLSDGIAEEILSAASRLSGLRVAARTSSFALKNRGLTAAEIGQRLGVRHVLEGSLQRGGGTFRIRTRLVDARTQQEVWSGRFESDGSDLFALEDSIATAVVAAIAGQTGGTSAAAHRIGGTQDSAAHHAYLAGLQSLRERGTSADLLRAINRFDAAIARDSNYPQPWAGLGSAWALLPEYGGAGTAEALRQGRRAIERALALDSTSAEAWAALGYVRKSHEWDWPGAEAAFRRALASDPNNATNHQWYGEHLSNLGRYREAAEEFEQALSLDPYSPVVQMAAGANYLAADRREEGRKALNRSLELDPNLWPAHFQLLLLDLTEHKPEAARADAGRLARALRADSAVFGAVVDGVLDAPGARTRALGIVRRWEETAAQPSLVIASWYTLLQSRDEAMKTLERAVAQREPFMPLIGWWPALRTLHDVPRFQLLLDRLNLRRKPGVRVNDVQS